MASHFKFYSLNSTRNNNNNYNHYYIAVCDDYMVQLNKVSHIVYTRQLFELTICQNNYSPQFPFDLSAYCMEVI